MEETETVVQTIDITEETLESEMPHLREVLSSSSFVTFDMEFSGIDIKKEWKEVSVDTVWNVYLFHCSLRRAITRQRTCKFNFSE